MTTRLHFKSLRTRLVVFFLAVSILALAAVVTTLYFQRAAVLRDLEFEKLQVVRDLKVREVNNWLEQRMNDLSVLLEDPQLRNYTFEDALLKKRSEWSHQELEAVDTVRTFFQRFTDTYPTYSEALFVGADSGRVEICTNPDYEGKDESTNPYFTEPMRTGQPYIKDIYYSEAESAPSMTFSAPVSCLTHDGDHTIGVLVLRASVEQDLYPLLQERMGMGETGETLIVNRDGFALNELRWAEDAPLSLQITAEPAVRGASGDTGIVEAEDYRGQMVLAAYTHVPLTGWGFVAKRDLTEIYSPIRTMLRDMTILGCAAALIIILVSMLLARSISRPILSIGEAVGRFAEGDLEARWLARGADEITALGGAFNEMAANLASQIVIRQGGAELSEAIRVAATVEDFASGVLIQLLETSDSHLGAFYMRVGDGQVFETIASIGLTSEAVQSFNAEGYEGELGKALATGQISHIQDIPTDTTFTFKTTGGTAIPREIITIPLTVDSRVMGVISLATLGSYSDTHRLILEQMQNGMDTAFSNQLAKAKMEQLAEELGASNEELSSTNEELQEQAEELQAQAEELDAQHLQVVVANRLKSEFLSNMSHELRTPLNSVLALSQLMLGRGVGTKPSEDAEHLRVIERNGRQLLSLINDILDLSKIEAGRVELTLADFDPRELVERTRGTMQPLVDEKGLRIEVTSAEVFRMYSDEERIGQIVLNLLSNAVKFTDQGQINIDVSASEGMISFAVTDTGIGIDGIDLPHIFEEFRQVDGSTTRRYEGTGLGLSICQRLAHLLGGEIVVESTLEVGSTFTLHLPEQCPEVPAEGALQATPQAAAAVPGGMTRKIPSPRRQHTSGDKPLILVVEDNKVAALQVCSTLEGSGYRVIVADDGVAGLNAVREKTPDAIILDLMMPGIDGFEVLEQIRSEATNTDLPVLVLTAKELTAAERARLTRNNIHQLIRKGDVNRDELVACVAEMFEEEAKPEPRPLPAASVTSEASSSPSERGKNILIVEDNPDNLLVIEAILDDAGFQYSTVRDGEQAVRMAKKSRPDLILMDIQLPVMSGIEATRRIKADPELKRTPIVALTAKAMTGDREEILAAGCDDYLTKPLDSSKLISVVRRWLKIDEAAS